MTKRIMPPPGGGKHVLFDKTYACAEGATIDVPDNVAGMLVASGWSYAAQGNVGATTARPANPSKGTQFHDSTLNITITYDGKTWRNPATGAAV